MSTPPAPATNTTAPPPQTVTAPPPVTPSSPPPSDSAPPPTTTSPPTSPPPTTPAPPPPPTIPVTSPPPPASASSPPPTSDSPPSPSNASPPVTSAPPPPTSTSPPPTSSASPPPPSTSPPPATSASPPPPSSAHRPPPPSISLPPTSSASPPAPPSTNSTTPPSSSGSTPEWSSPPPPADLTSSPSGISTAVVVGITIGGVAILLILILLFVCYRKKRRKNHNEEAFHAQPPFAAYKDDPYGGDGPPNYLRQNAPPFPAPIVGLMSNPSPPPAVNASTPPFLQPYMSSSGGSGSNYSGPETPLPPPPPPGSVLGSSKSSFSYEELALATDGFSEANLLGQGGFGYVHKGVLPNGKDVAVKQLKAGSGQGEREFQAEVEIISRVHHKHLVSLVGYCISGSQRMLVYEYVPNNTMEFHLHGKGRPTLDWSSRMTIALGSAKGLAYLHEDCNPKIIHRDIKAANILLDFKFEAKVADFGLAKLTSDINTHVSTRVMGTFGYLAPEYASSGKLSEKSDVFSFGVMLLEFITGHRPVNTTQTFMEDSLVDWARPLLVRAVEEEIFDGLVDPKLKGNYSPAEMARMVACAAACVRHSAKRRPKMSQVVRALEGEASLADLNKGVRPGHSTVYGESSDYDTSQYKEDMKKFRKMALGSQEYGTSAGYSGGGSDYDLYPSGSSSDAQTTREIEMRKVEE